MGDKSNAHNVVFYNKPNINKIMAEIERTRETKEEIIGNKKVV